MMKRYSSRELIKMLKADGWESVAVAGSHHQFKHPDKPGRVTVPHPRKDLPTPTICSIFRQAGWQQ
ncbi:type II toxin-antitoxin system HicA family toxin [Pistricoccus aurantiacus]|uniref:type II toxin-antitoxin system HicA family toxin n=1 Tax=Pistricoccus aurantiacus TaxID=1883414 RepID=UPI0036426A97